MPQELIGQAAGIGRAGCRDWQDRSLGQAGTEKGANLEKGFAGKHAKGYQPRETVGSLCALTSGFGEVLLLVFGRILVLGNKRSVGRQVQLAVS